ncbi:MAG TPA: TIGR04086 family membrane protein [Bacillota bacterium]|nr:TIGR04086 family membrane protein [Bacillota bacterium]
MKSVVASSSPILTGIVATLVLMLLGSVVTSLFLQFSSITEMKMPIFTYLVNGISLFIGGLLAGKKGGQKGWYFGGLTGISYFILLVLIGFLAYDITPKLNALVYFTFSFLIGAFGGIFGVNMANK